MLDNEWSLTIEISHLVKGNYTCDLSKCLCFSGYGFHEDGLKVIKA